MEPRQQRPLGDQGSTAVLTSNTGSVLLKESYAAFGAARSGTTWSGAVATADQTTMVDISRHGYTDHTMLGFGGLIHMNGRVQDAITGRFLSPDPHTSEPWHTQGYNRYAYVRNNPVSYTDPTGLDLADLLQWLCNTSTGMCPPIAVPWELEEVTVSAARFVQDAQAAFQEFLRQQREGSSAAQTAAGGGGESGGGGGDSATPQSHSCNVRTMASAATAIDMASGGFINTDFERNMLINFLSQGQDVQLSAGQMSQIRSEVADSFARTRGGFNLKPMVGPVLAIDTSGVSQRNVYLGRLEGGEFDGSLGTSTGYFQGEQLLSIADNYDFLPQDWGQRGTGYQRRVELGVRVAGTIANFTCGAFDGFKVTGQ